MLNALLTFLNSPAGQAAAAGSVALFERGLAAIEALIEAGHAKNAGEAPKQ